MTNNMYVKHTLLIFITFFTLNYTASENEYPLKQILRAFTIWICYLLFTKQNITFTMLSVGIVIVTYGIDTFSIYYGKKTEEINLEEKEKKDNKDKYDLLNKIKNYLFVTGILTIIIGFSLYFREKYIEYGNEFNTLTFIFGKTTCDSLK